MGTRRRDRANPLRSRRASPRRTTLTCALVGLAVACVSGSCASGAHDPLQIEGVHRFRLSIGKLAGTRIAAWEAGSEGARRLIFVHGTPGSAAMWRRYLADPVPGLHAIAFDRPGFGRTRPPAALVSFEAQAAALEPLLAPSRQGRWPILVGHSLGGPIIARAAADHPERVAGLVILAGSLDPMLERPRWFNRLADWMPVRLLLGQALRHANDEILAAPRHTRELAGILDRVRCPVVILHGTEDSLVPYENVRFMQRAFVNAASVEVVSLEGADHFIPWTHEQRVRDAVESLARESVRREKGNRGDRISERAGPGRADADRST